MIYKLFKVNTYLIISCLFFFLNDAYSLTLNNPYDVAELHEKTYFSDFREAPKYLDPAKAYSSDEYRILGAVTEPLLGYDYFSDAYTLTPLGAEKLPEGLLQNEKGDFELVIRIKDNMKFAPHPCFLESKALNLELQNITHAVSPFELNKTSRPVTAHDFALQIKRMADPRLQCPIFPMVLVPYIKGMTEFQTVLNQEIESVRRKSLKNSNNTGVFDSNVTLDEKKSPVVLDYNRFECEGVQVTDTHTLKLVLNQNAPQILYWLAMPFFSPVPFEALQFYAMPQIIQKGWRFDRYPVSNGPFYVHEFNDHYLIQLNRNRDYPTRTVTDDKGRELQIPHLRSIKFYRESESISRWLKFKQGYFDISGIANDHFFEVFQSGSMKSLSEFFTHRHIKMSRVVLPSVIYMGFNMLDPLVGGLSEEKQYLRQAICIAIDREQYIEQFLNGRGKVAHSPLPPGIYGHDPLSINEYVYSRDHTSQSVKRKSIEEAKLLLEKAGYPGGVNPKTGEGLILFFDTLSVAGNVAYKDWLQKQFKKLNIYLEFRETDYNRFREKMENGSCQLYSWGWNADYPDPENFLFLFYGKNGKAKFKGENGSNYENPEFDALFSQITGKPNDTERLKLIQKMTHILQKDCPWDFGFYPESVALVHDWVNHYRLHPFSHEGYSFIDVDQTKRIEYQSRENKVHPFSLFFIAIFCIGICAGIYGMVRKGKS